MPDLPQKKVGIVACSGEELAQGTVTRLAALRVLEQLRPADTVTICLPLFLAGGENERAFARFYPTIAIDGCQRRCAARATARYSAQPAAAIVVDDLVREAGLNSPAGLRRLNESGQQAVEVTAARVAQLVDQALDKRWSRRRGAFAAEDEAGQQPSATKTATCACGSGIPIQTVTVDGQPRTVVALPLLLEQLYETGKQPDNDTAAELLEQVTIYNPIPEAERSDYQLALLQAYAAFCGEKESVS